jgi:hypothetical protein
MEGKVFKRLTMLSLVSMFTLCAAVTSANAQLSNPVRARVPFDFNVGEKKLPAGDYTFRSVSGFSGGNLIEVSTADGHRSALQPMISAQLLTSKTKTSLIFHRYGDQYFLAQIWRGGEQEGTEVPESRSERTIRRHQLAQTQQSNMSGKMEKVETVDIVATSF